MSDFLVAAAVFACLALASFGAMALSPRLAERHRDEETTATLRQVATVFTIMTSLVFGLMINSAKNTYEAVNANVHDYATSLILLDRMLRHYGLAGDDAREQLIAYVQEAIARPARGSELERGARDTAGLQLDALGDALAVIQPADSYHEGLLLDARQQYREIVEQRWTIVEQSEGALPMPLVAMLVAWLTLIFASYGYRAPANRVVGVAFLVAAGLIAASFYLVLDMEVPFHGPIQISDAPLHRALAEMGG